MYAAVSRREEVDKEKNSRGGREELERRRRVPVVLDDEWTSKGKQKLSGWR